MANYGRRQARRRYNATFGRRSILGRAWRRIRGPLQRGIRTGLRFIGAGNRLYSAARMAKGLYRNYRRSSFPKRAVAMFRAPRKIKFHNYPLAKRVSRQTWTMSGVWQALSGNCSYDFTAWPISNDSMSLGPMNPWVMYRSPVKAQTTQEYLTRVGDEINIVAQSIRFCVDAKPSATDAYCCRLIVKEFDIRESNRLADIDANDTCWRMMMMNPDIIGRQALPMPITAYHRPLVPNITTWSVTATTPPAWKRVEKYRLLYDMTFTIGTVGSSISHKDLTLRFPRRKEVYSRFDNDPTSIPESGKAYYWIVICDAAAGDPHMPDFQWTVKTTIQE